MGSGSWSESGWVLGPGLVPYRSEFGQPLQVDVPPQVKVSAQADQHGAALLLSRTLQRHLVDKCCHDGCSQILRPADGRHDDHAGTQTPELVQVQQQ